MSLIRVVLFCSCCVSTAASTGAPFPSMIFFENGTHNGTAAYSQEQMHKDQVELASHFQLAIVGWGEDQDSIPVCLHQEEKLANISAEIKAKSPSTRTAVYAGQFEFVVPCYDIQRRIMEDPAYDGMFMKDDAGHVLKQGTFFIWDFRNASAVAYHTKLAGYFAENAPGVDAVFFDEGDSFACGYDCKQHNTCRTMPNASDWHKGAIQAWIGAAQVMASVGKRAILSSQNAFNGSSPELFKHHGCPYLEDVPAQKMAELSIPWMRFYEYWLVPEQFAGKQWQYCRNQVANAVEEGKRTGMHFVAAGTSPLPGWGTPERISALEFSLAGFLIAKGHPDVEIKDVSKSFDGSVWDGQADFFGFDHQGLTEGCKHTRWGDCDHNYTEVEALYARDYGLPMSDAIEVGEVGSGRFFRQYTNVNITFDCGKSGERHANFTWASPDEPVVLLV